MYNKVISASISLSTATTAKLPATSSLSTSNSTRITSLNIIENKNDPVLQLLYNEYMELKQRFSDMSLKYEAMDRNLQYVQRVAERTGTLDQSNPQNIATLLLSEIMQLRESIQSNSAAPSSSSSTAVTAPYN